MRDEPGSDLTTAAPGSEAPELEAARLRDRLAEVELEHATLQSELTTFHADYMRQVGVVMARVHELEARLLRVVAERSGTPGDERAADAAEERSRRSTADVKAVPEPGGPPPTADLKRLFREAAKRMHPDLARDDEARAHAEAFMKRLTQAYRDGDGQAIADLLRQWEASPLSRAGGPDSPDAARRVAAREAVAQRAAVGAAERRLAETRGSQLADLLEQVMAASAAGEDLLARMRTDAQAALRTIQARLAAVEQA
jgi:nucleoid-associated protein YgaU